MKQTTYVCDRCGKTLEPSKKPINVRLVMQVEPIVKRIDLELCCGCADRLVILNESFYDNGIEEQA